MSEQRETLDRLIVEYAENKQELDSLKKLVEVQNNQIKSLMNELSITEYSADDCTAKYNKSEREKIEEEPMIMYLKNCWKNEHGSDECPFVKTKEYLDNDALEDAIYNKLLNKETMKGMSQYIKITPVETLRVTRKKVNK